MFGVFGHTKINQFDSQIIQPFVMTNDHDVVKFQIPMDYIGTMEILGSVQQLTNYYLTFGLR